MEKMYYEQLGYDFDPPFYSSTSVPVITNYDRVIRKAPEELAEWLSCNCTGDGYGNSAEDWLDWLKQEVSS